jgi:hypothetical protein
MAAEFASEFTPVLRAYVVALRSRVGSFPFSYADGLSRRMRRVFAAASRPGLKSLALESILVAAVALNRYAAMAAFNRLLMSVTSVEIALPDAEMLRERSPYYTEVAHGAPPDRLHPAIRDVQQVLLSTTEIPV